MMYYKSWLLSKNDFVFAFSTTILYSTFICYVNEILIFDMKMIVSFYTKNKIIFDYNMKKKCNNIFLFTISATNNTTQSYHDISRISCHKYLFCTCGNFLNLFSQNNQSILCIEFIQRTLRHTIQLFQINYPLHSTGNKHRLLACKCSYYNYCWKEDRE